MSALVGVIMGSDSDWPTMQAATEALDEFGVPYQVHVVSAHRTPQRMLEYAQGAVAAGLKVIIAGAGGAAHLPGMVAAATPLPVIGVPVPLRHLVATVAIGGARNAGLLAVRILATGDPQLLERMQAYQEGLARVVAEKDDALRGKLGLEQGGR